MKKNIEKPDNYENMSAEEKLAFYEGFEFDDNSELVQKLKDSVSNANSQAADWKKKHNALLSADEKAKADRDEELTALREEVEALRKKEAVSKYVAKYSEIGYDAKLAESTAQALADGDFDTVIANQEAYKKSLQSKIAAELMSGTPHPQTGTGVKMTKEEIMKIKDPVERQSKIAENIELFRTGG